MRSFIFFNTTQDVGLLSHSCSHGSDEIDLKFENCPQSTSITQTDIIGIRQLVHVYVRFDVVKFV